MKPCAIVPTHNHWLEIGEVVHRLKACGLSVFVIDDGSSEPAGKVIADLHDPMAGVLVTRLERNCGKGKAVVVGLRQARASGFSHAVQVDADGQHDLDALPDMLAVSAAHPEALISGRPIYDTSVPRGRRIGRWLTHVWVWIETLSLQIVDSMCGFRVYPVDATIGVLDNYTVGHRMDFDTEIMVRLFWHGTPVIAVPVRVVYPPGNTSNFALFGDNWRITKMHTRLVMSMLLHLPQTLMRRPRRMRNNSTVRVG